LAATQNRLLEAYSTDATKKYLQLLKTFPDILQRVPQYMIASYLGMSRETLSRVRKHISNSK
jgi:CRP-like cAMP-binding protein